MEFSTIDARRYLKISFRFWPLLNMFKILLKYSTEKAMKCISIYPTLVLELWNDGSFSTYCDRPLQNIKQ